LEWYSDKVVLRTRKISLTKSSILSCTDTCHVRQSWRSKTNNLGLLTYQKKLHSRSEHGGDNNRFYPSHSTINETISLQWIITKCSLVSGVCCKTEIFVKDWSLVQSYRVWCVWVWLWSLENGRCPGPLGAVAPLKKSTYKETSSKPNKLFKVQEKRILYNFIKVM